MYVRDVHTFYVGSCSGSLLFFVNVVCVLWKAKLSTLIRFPKEVLSKINSSSSSFLLLLRRDPVFIRSSSVRTCLLLSVHQCYLLPLKQKTSRNLPNFLLQSFIICSVIWIVLQLYRIPLITQIHCSFFDSFFVLWSLVNWKAKPSMLDFPLQISCMWYSQIIIIIIYYHHYCQLCTVCTQYVGSRSGIWLVHCCSWSVSSIESNICQVD